MYIFLSGNILEGFTAYGPYSDIETVFENHDMDEGALMTLRDK